MGRREAEAQEQERISKPIDVCREWKAYVKENNMVVKKNSKKKMYVAKMDVLSFPLVICFSASALHHQSPATLDQT